MKSFEEFNKYEKVDEQLDESAMNSIDQELGELYSDMDIDFNKLSVLLMKGNLLTAVKEIEQVRKQFGKIMTRACFMSI